MKMSTTSCEPSPSPSPASGSTPHSTKTYGTLVPNRVFVGGISSSTTEADLHQLFSSFGNVKATKIISDRGGCSKGYGFVTFETEEQAKKLQSEADNIILKERKLNIAPAIKKQQSYAPRTYEMGQPVMNGAIYYHNGVPYTYQNGVAWFSDAASAAAAAGPAPANLSPFMTINYIPGAASSNPSTNQQPFNIAGGNYQSTLAASASSNQQMNGVTNGSSGQPPWRWISTGPTTPGCVNPSTQSPNAPMTHHIAFPQSPYTVPPPIGPDSSFVISNSPPPCGSSLAPQPELWFSASPAEQGGDILDYEDNDVRKNDGQIVKKNGGSTRSNRTNGRSPLNQYRKSESGKKSIFTNRKSNSCNKLSRLSTLSNNNNNNTSAGCCHVCPSHSPTTPNNYGKKSANKFNFKRMLTDTSVLDGQPPLQSQVFVYPGHYLQPMTPITPTVDGTIRMAIPGTPITPWAYNMFPQSNYSASETGLYAWNHQDYWSQQLIPQDSSEISEYEHEIKSPYNNNNKRVSSFKGSLSQQQQCNRFSLKRSPLHLVSPRGRYHRNKRPFSIFTTNGNNIRNNKNQGGNNSTAKSSSEDDLLTPPKTPTVGEETIEETGKILQNLSVD